LASAFSSALSACVLLPLPLLLLLRIVNTSWHQCCCCSFCWLLVVAADAKADHVGLFLNVRR